MRRRLTRHPALLVLACAASLAAAPGASAATSGSLSIHGFINHFFSYRLSGCGNQTVGYDNSRDGVIDVQQEGERVDGRCRVWQAHRFLKAVDAATGRDIFITRSDLRSYLRSFDRNGNGRIDSANHEFQRLYRAVFHTRAPRRARYQAFERRFYG